ncbi:hypothetical protein HDU98_007402 [Podochytrium sp. JEL0797]|nr:hypothetical protein HDU98_007402 [Podochytrium sp. JEL0797]
MASITIDATTRASILARIVSKIRSHYCLKDKVGQRNTLSSLAVLVNAVLQPFDKHFAVKISEETAPEPLEKVEEEPLVEPSEQETAQMRERTANVEFGIPQAQMLPGYKFV